MTTSGKQQDRKEIPAELMGLINLLAELLAEEFLKEHGLA
jgi:hypothetical protein